MTLGRCPLSIFCSRGTPPREVYHRVGEWGRTLKMFLGKSSPTGGDRSTSPDSPERAADLHGHTSCGAAGVRLLAPPAVAWRVEG